MLESWFEHINTLLHTHPHLLAQLAFLWRVKCSLLTLLMAYFLYLIYREDARKAREKRKRVYHFEA